MVFKDFLSDEDGDLLIKNGDFVVGPSDAQNIQDIFDSFPGWWKQYPQVGIGIEQYLNSSGKEQEVKQIATQQLTADGFDVSLMKIGFGKNAAGDPALLIDTNTKRNG